MQYSIKKKLYVNLTLDSSETVIFNQGGKHHVQIDPDCFGESDLNEVEVSVQLAPACRGRHDWILNEANKHKERVKSEEDDEG